MRCARLASASADPRCWRHGLRLLWPPLWLLAWFLPVAGMATDAPAPAKPAPVVLVTAFSSFAGRTVNGSQTLARALDGTHIGAAVIATAVLPVRWGAPAGTLPGLVQRLQPVLLLGLGEGYPDAVACETTARNLALGADEAGVAAPALLDSTGPAERHARLAFDPGWFLHPAFTVKASDDAGSYLCNNLLYVAAAQPVTMVGFVHVPPQGGTGDDVYQAALLQGGTGDDVYQAALLPIIRSIIAHNLH